MNMDFVKNKSRYEHSENFHNLDSAHDFVLYLNSIFQPKSVIDIGCGLGNFLFSFKELGVSDVLGIDGSWVKKHKRSIYLAETEFLEHNLELPLQLDKKYDLVLSLEVAEHLDENSAKIFVKNLVNAGDVIVFSAAIPSQGGQNHINEQWQSYWCKLFSDEDYELKDIIRPNLWHHKKIPWWYRQNSFVYLNKKVTINLPDPPPLLDIVHPEFLKFKTKRFTKVMEGKLSVLFYFKLFLKSIINLL
jgi:SAM-dependent methyltransferase